MTGPTSYSTPFPANEAELVAAPPAPIPVDEWRRVNIRTILVRPFNEILGFIPLLIGVIALGQHNQQKIWYGLGVIALLLLRGLVHYFTTRYRITEDQVEVRTGLIFRKRETTKRDRVRTVESTAKFGHRLFGVTAVRIGTGQNEQKRRRQEHLDAVTMAEAERLRRTLLRRTPMTQAGSAGVAVAEQPGDTIAELSWGWLRYAPLTLSGLVALAALFGLIWRSANELDINLTDNGLLRDGVNWVEHTSTLTVIAVATVLALLVIVLGSMVVYVFQFTGFRLTREPDATLHVRRGLLTRSALTIEEARLRGVELREPLLLRLGRGARLSAVATGLRARSESHLLMPPGPVAEAHRVARAVLHGTPTDVPLTTHPRKARTRRLTRAIVPTAVLTAGLWLAYRFADWPAWLWIAGCVLVVLAVPLGLNRYRQLGHALTGNYLVTRWGSLNRRTVALQRTGIIGLKVHQSVFQRWAGVVSVSATTAAGRGAYRVLDVTESHGLALAEVAVPGLLEPFLVTE